ncbi:MAG: TonB-dependent receptor [Bacteroidales bacterium]|nr:TonB-dependent receptor [Bacteroidales bacterium]
MKFMFLFMVVATLCATAEIYPQYAKLSLNIKNGTLQDVFKEIESQSDFNIFYKVDQINVSKKVSLQADNLLISEILDQVLPKAEATYTVLDKIIVIRSLKENLKALKVTGNVVDDETGEPLPGVNIVIKGTTDGTVTDMSGNFNLEAEEDALVLQVSFVGYISKEVPVNGAGNIEIRLAPDVMGLEEVVVIGYGVEKKSLVTGSISTVKAEDIANTSISRAEQALQGRTAGVYVLPASGSPGAGIKVRIRGAGSNGKSEPLYIVDGVKTSNINYLDPGDIERMEVLKDAASSAIYGAEGANGVVIISTKSGVPGKSTVEYSFQYGIQSPGRLPELMNAAQYVDFMSESIIPAVTASDYDTDWLGLIFDNAPMQKHHLSFSGGNEMTTFVSSLSYYNQDGILGGDKANFKRMSGRLNIDHKVNNWLKVGSKVAYTNSKRAALPEDSEFDGLLAGALGIDPLTPPYYNDTTDMPTSIRELHRKLYKDATPIRKAEDGRYFGISQYIQGEVVNPLLRLDLAQGSTNTDNILGNFYVEISPVKDLTYTSRIGIDYSSQSYKFWNPVYYYSSDRSNGTTSVTDESFTENKWQWENFLTFNKELGEMNMNIVAGMSAEALDHRILHATKERMFIEDELYAQLNYTAEQKGTMKGNLFKERLVSYFGRVSFNMLNRYMLQASIRRDGASTSLLPPDSNWGIFPSFSAGWVLSEEDFFPKEIINFMKLRASWGQNGSLANLKSAWTEYEQFSPFQKISQFAYLDAVVNEYILYNGFTGSEPDYLPNPDLTWETSQQTDIGLDMRFLRGRLSFTADYYVKQTKDLLALISAPAPAGNDPSFSNVGDVKNSGFEFDLGYRDYEGDFHYGFNVNLSTLKNEVTKLNADAARLPGMRVGPSWMGATAFEVGEPVWYFRGFQTAGFASDGSPIFVDVSGPDGTPDGVLTDDDLTNIGNPHPKIIYGGGLNFEFKGLDFNIFAQGVAGNKVLMAFVRSDRATCNKPTVFYENTAFRNKDVPEQAYRSDMLVFDGSYMRIKQIQLGYSLPAAVLGRVGIGKTRLYVSLEDYFTFTKYEGMDPEAGSGEDSSLGIDRGVYPIPRKVLFGLSVSF